MITIIPCSHHYWVGGPPKVYIRPAIKGRAASHSAPPNKSGVAEVCIYIYSCVRILGKYRDYTGIMEKKMEATIYLNNFARASCTSEPPQQSGLDINNSRPC